ncbi:hypothetical protein [Paracoccus sp. ME4]|uniref:hypothetical protein n=1 Tax=Paracoccus sp. ME4 TaxID=3138066 RepID=UPI00398B4867
MSQGRAVLKAITNRDYRKQVETLLDAGWSASRTGKNHFRLSHPLAHRDVITSGTPSDHRAAENLKSQCRRALQMPAGDMALVQPFACAQMPKIVEEARAHRKPRWNDDDRMSRKARRENVVAAPATAPGCFPIRAERPELSNLDDKVREAILAEAFAREAATQSVPVEHSGHDIANNDNGFKENEDMPKLITNAASKTAAPILSLVTDAAGAATEPAAVNTPEVPAGALPRLDADLLAVAMRVLSGELRGIAITPDMVGKTLVLGAEAWIVDGTIPTMRAPIAAEARTGADRSHGASTAPAFSSDEPAMLALREALETFKGTWLRLSDILSLIPKADDATERSHKENARRRLNHLTAIGQVVRKQSGTSTRSAMLYCIAS